MPSQNYTADDSLNRYCECSKMQLFEPMCESSHCRGKEWSVFGSWFSCLLGRQLANKWLCTTQNSLFCILVVRLRYVQFFRKNRRSLAWKCFVSEQLLLDLAHLETAIQSTAVYVWNHTRKSMIYHLVRCHSRVLNFWSISFDQSIWAFFWVFLQILGGIQCEQTNECKLVPRSCNVKAKGFGSKC